MAITQKKTRANHTSMKMSRVIRPQLITKDKGAESLLFTHCAQCGFRVDSIKGDSHNYCKNCGFRDSCC